MAMRLQSTKDKQLSRWTVENSYQLNTHDLGKKLLKPGLDGQGKAGKTFATNSWEIMEVHYQIVPGKRPHVILNYFKNGRFEKDMVYLASQKITFGVKVYFLCTCGRKCLKLFTRKSCYGFGCRNCQNLGYEIHKFNRRGTWGALAFYINRHQKIELMKLGVKHVSYRGRMTRRATAVLKALKKWAIPATIGALIGL
jgi:hypothetical protein